MNERVSETILLCEDDPQEKLVRFYLKKCGFRTDPPSLRLKNASRIVHGGNVSWVLKEFAGELKACRHRHATRAATLLIVVVDADNKTIEDRLSDLNKQSKIREGDPIAVLIPKRNIETWIRSALGQLVNETDDYKKPEPKGPEIRDAANQIYGWARSNPAPGTTCVDSLKKSIPHWLRIG